MGNQLLRNHEIEKEPYLSAGFKGQWKVYSASKIDDKAVYSAFVFKKRVLKGKNIPNPIKEDVFAALKKEPQNLAKLKHPSIVSLSEPVSEHKKYLVFSTEKVLHSLDWLFSQEGPVVSELFASETEFKLHLLEIIDAINFLHNTVKTPHLNLAPESIYVTEGNRWKLSGLNFAQLGNQNPAGNPEDKKQAFKENEAILKDLPGFWTPDLDFAAPEISEGKASFAADIFSMGMIIVKIAGFPDEKEPYKASSLGKHCEEITAFVANREKHAFYPKIMKKQSSLMPLLLRMLSVSPQSRPTIQEILSSGYFSDPLVQTLNYLDSLSQKDEFQQTSFFKGLLKILPKFEGVVVKKRIVPKIMDFIQKDHCSSVIVQIVFQLLEKQNEFSREDFMSVIWPGIKQLPLMKEISAQTLFLLVGGLPRLCDFITNEELKSSLFPLFMKCFDCKVPKLEEAILKNTEAFIKKLEFSVIKNRILPKVLKLCADEKHETRKNAILALEKIYTIFDKTTINELILPALEKGFKTQDSEVIFSVLAMYEGISKIIGLEGITGKILPQLIPPMGEKGISRAEFEKRHGISMNLLKIVWEEKSKEFEQILEEKTKEKQKIDKAMNEIEEISRENGEVPKKEENSDNFEFLRVLKAKPVAFNEEPKSSSLANPTNESSASKTLLKLQNPSNNLNIIDSHLLNNNELSVQSPGLAQNPTISSNLPNNLLINKDFSAGITPTKIQNPMGFNSINPEFPGLNSNLASSLTDSQQKKSKNPFEELLSSGFKPIGNDAKFNRSGAGNGFGALEKEFGGFLVKSALQNPEKSFGFVDKIMGKEEKTNLSPFDIFSAVGFNVGDQKKHQGGPVQNQKKPDSDHNIIDLL